MAADAGVHVLTISPTAAGFLRQSPRLTAALDEVEQLSEADGTTAKLVQVIASAPCCSRV